MSYGVVCNFAKREDGKEQTMTKIYRVQMNSKGQPNFSTAVEVADRPQGEWIPVSERLPKARESVILSTKEWTGEGCYWETTKHHVIWKGYGWNATYWDDEVVAWKPLPMPYREDGET